MIFNAKHQRTGTIWEGRFKSCLVDSDNYLFSLYKHIEMNPVKANDDYQWPSYHHNKLDISQQHDRISKATLAGDVYGDDDVHTLIERLTSRPTKRTSHGGDRKSKTYHHNQAG